MKRTTSIWMIFFSTCLTLTAQSDKFSFQFENIELEQALKTLGDVTGYDFTYVNEAIPNKFISGNWQDMSIDDILKDLLKDEILSFSKSGKTYTIFTLRNLISPFQIFGRITDSQSGEFLTGTNIFTNANQGVISDNYGLYSIEVDPVRDSLIYFSYLGYEPTLLQVNRLLDGRTDIQLKADFNVLEEVTITLEKQVQRPAIPSKNVLTAETYQMSKAISGDQDIIEYINIIPGVVKMSEGKSGYSVQGSAPDQNLILIDEAPVFNPSHALGFLSVFNDEALNSAIFHKTAISSKYGGRLASVLDIRMREGNANKHSATITTNPFYSGLTLEGPILKENMSFLISGRLAHMNYILNRFEPEKDFYVPKSIYFYDLHGKVNLKLGNNNRIYLSSFINSDEINPHTDPDENFFYDTKWQNRTFTFRWNSIWNDKLFTNASFIFSDYEYIKSTSADTSKLKYEEMSAISNAHIKLEATYHVSKGQKLSAGFNATNYTFNPATGSISVPAEDFRLQYSIAELRSRELAIFIEENIKIGRFANVNLGLRYSKFYDMGNNTFEYEYDEDGIIIDSLFREKNKTIRTFDNIEPRISLDLQLLDKLLLQTSWSRTSQYILRLLNDNPTTPNEYWIPAGQRINPLSSNILALSLDWQMTNFTHLHAGVFNRVSTNVSAFKNGANIFFSESLIDRQITQGDFRSSGFEISLEKKKSQYRYFLSYSYSDSKVRFDDINDGNYYNADANFQHDFNLQGSLIMSKNISLGANWQLRSGDLITLPSGFGYVAGFPFEIYTDRNNYRLPNYNRLDISANLLLIQRDRYKVDLSLGVYNLTGQFNAFQSTVTPDVGPPKIETLALSRTTPFIHLKLSVQ